MPIQKKWSAFIRENLNLVPRGQGVYELGDAKETIVYIGSSREGEDIRCRLLFHKKQKSRSVKYFRFELAPFLGSTLDMEVQHCNLFYDKYGRLPRLQKRIPRGCLNSL